MIQIQEVQSKKDLKEFIDLPWKLYKDDSNWVPQLKLAQKDILSPKHPFYETGEMKSWLAIQDHEVVGRISAIRNDHYNQYHNVQVGFFGFFETINDDRVSHQLIETAKTWFRDQKLTEIIGPANPSTNYEAGLLIEGFDDPPQVMMTYNPAYYMELLEKEGLHKAKDLFAHRLPTDSEVPAIINKIAERAKSRHNISYRYLNKKNWKAEVDMMLDIYNDAWENNWGFVPMTEKEFRHTAADLKMIAQENLALIAEVKGEPAGMLVALPDINQVLIKNPSGNLFPFGIFKLLNHKKYTNRMRIPIMGVKQKFQKIGLSSLLLQRIREEAVKTQYKDCECSWILEDNHNMNKPLFTYGSEVYKKYRLYKGDL